jgi:nicotinamidase-related amidase
MSQSDDNLHGDLAARSPVALLLVDVINDLEFAGSESLGRHALAMAEPLRDLCNRARSRKVPLIYVNDNFGRWRSDFQAQVQHCLHDGVRGEPIVRLLQPSEDDYFVLKPKHSGFYLTSLDLLLDSLGVGTLILTGIATNICVLFTANDAYMRDYRLFVPADCCAANSLADHANALELMQRVLKADTRPGSEIDFRA